MDDFCHVIEHIYRNAQYEELRPTTARISHENLDALLRKDPFVCVLKDIPGFAADLVQLMTAEARQTVMRIVPSELVRPFVGIVTRAPTRKHDIRHVA